MKGILLLIGLSAISIAEANTISGSVSLPSGTVAPAGGLNLTMRSLRFDDFGFGRDNITIAAGQSSATYVLQFSDDSDRDLVFDCDACAEIDVTTEGGWSNSEGVVGSFSGQTFSGSQDHVVNILLQRADVFRGTLSLPPGLVANGGEFLFVSIRSSDRFALDSFGDGEILSAGQTSFDFAIGAPSGGTGTGWEIRFVCLSCENRIESASHYATELGGGVPTLDSDSAFRFIRNVDYSGINLALIDTQPVVEPSNKVSILAPIYFLLED